MASPAQLGTGTREVNVGPHDAALGSGEGDTGDMCVEQSGGGGVILRLVGTRAWDLGIAPRPVWRGLLEGWWFFLEWRWRIDYGMYADYKVRCRYVIFGVLSVRCFIACRGSQFY